MPGAALRRRPAFPRDDVGVEDIGVGYILELRDPDGMALELFAAAA